MTNFQSFILVLLCASSLYAQNESIKKIDFSDTVVYVNFKKEFRTNSFSSESSKFNFHFRYAASLQYSEGRNTGSQVVDFSMTRTFSGMQILPLPDKSTKYWGVDKSDTSFTIAGIIYIDPSDHQQRTFCYGRHRDGTILAGLTIKDGNIFLRRFVNVPNNPNGSNGNTYDFRQWDPVVAKKAGWYFIALTQTNFISRVYLGGLDTEDDIGVRYSFFGFQPIDNIKTWGIGDSRDKSVTKVDELVVYNQHFKLEDMYALYDCVKAGNSLNSSSCVDFYQKAVVITGGSRRSARIPYTEKNKSSRLATSVYPNPSNGTFHLLFELKDLSDVDISIYDLKGSVIYSDKRVGQIGLNDLIVEMPSGIIFDGHYVISVKTKEFNYKDHIIFKR